MFARADFLSDEAIYIRTAAGQREVIFDPQRLPHIARRFLLLVNGATPRAICWTSCSCRMSMRAMLCSRSSIRG